jgi:co-chaperonin GroES (HSP10)
MAKNRVREIDTKPQTCAGAPGTQTCDDIAEEAASAVIDPASFPIKPTGWNIAVIPIDAGRKIVLPDGSKTLAAKPIVRVLAVGNGITQNGVHVPVTYCKPGDIVVLGANTSAQMVEWGGAKCYITPEHNVIAVLDRECGETGIILTKSATVV